MTLFTVLFLKNFMGRMPPEKLPPATVVLSIAEKKFFHFQQIPLEALLNVSRFLGLRNIGLF